MKFIDWFAGIGGFRRGLELAGHECVGACEWDKFARASYISMHLITEDQRKYLATLPLKQRQKEILKEKYLNGEWFADDIRTVVPEDIPKSDCWCFGAPCQDFSVAGRRAGLEGERSSLVREIFRLLAGGAETDKPEWLIYENVKGMFSSNGGIDYLSIISEMDELGYDVQWQNINSAWFVPQNRERIYTVGHLRRCSSTEIFPIKGADGENNICQLGQRKSQRNNPDSGRVYDADGIAPTLNTMSGGGREPHVAQPCFCDCTIGGGYKRNGDFTNPDELLSERGFISQSGLQLRTHSDRRKGGDGRVMCNTNPSGKGMNGNVYDSNRDSPAITTNKGEGFKVAVPVLTPDRAEKRQNGRRMKENGEPEFTLTAQDHHGVAINVDSKDGVYTNTLPDFQSGILDRESEKHDEAVALGIVDTQGRNGKKVSPSDTVPTLRAQTHGNVPEVVEKVEDKTNEHKPIYVELPNGVIAYAVWYEKYQCYITIRKLTPKECFRLQGWTDDYFEKARFVNSDSQLYKQAGNGVTVNVVETIGRKIPK